MRLGIIASLLFGLGCDQTIKLPPGASTGSGSAGLTGGQNLLAAGARCTFNAACASGVCGPSGTGNCCAQACATSDLTCGAIACDGTGACDYPNDAITCPSSCSGSTLSQNTCNGEGACAPGSSAASSAPCPGNFACGRDGGLCDTTCTSSTECATGFVCNAGACVPPIPVGPCTENDDCTSARCGINGAGHCCSTTCALTDPPCGATDCRGDDGACDYPNPGTLCGPDQSCVGGVQTSAEHCDGAGTCISGTTSVDCAPYVCGVNTCLRNCGQDGGCAAGGSCDLFHDVCCVPGLEAGSSMSVDSVTGDDGAACCGTDGGPPCQSITHAMQVIDRDRLRDVTILATVDGGSGYWPDVFPETYPIVLGWGAELNAPGVTFSIPNNFNTIIFTIGRVSANDFIGYASIVGIGTLEPTNLTHIQIESGNTLYLANAIIEGWDPSLRDADSAGSDIDVAAGATLVLGADRSGTATGTVTIAYAHTGIECEGGGGPDPGCTISDVPLDGGSSLIIIGAAGVSSQMAVGISAGDNTNISLKSAPIIGGLLGEGNGPAFLNCADFIDFLGDNPAISQGVLLSGKATMTFENGLVDCVFNQGFYLEASSRGVPSLNLSNTIIQNSGLAVYASAGIATISSSTIQYNGGGVEQDSDGTNSATIDLSGGAAGGINIVACSNSIEGPGTVGVSVLNTTMLPLNASNVAWDTSEPDVFQCDAQLGNCSCEVASCAAAPGADGMDAVYESTGTITTTDNRVSTLDCTPPKGPCTIAQPTCDYPWEVCCAPLDGGQGECAGSCPGSG